MQARLMAAMLDEPRNSPPISRRDYKKRSITTALIKPLPSTRDPEIGRPVSHLLQTAERSEAAHLHGGELRAARRHGAGEAGAEGRRKLRPRQPQRVDAQRGEARRAGRQAGRHRVAARGPRLSKRRP